MNYIPAASTPFKIFDFGTSFEKDMLKRFFCLRRNSTEKSH